MMNEHYHEDEIESIGKDFKIYQQTLQLKLSKYYRFCYHLIGVKIYSNKNYVTEIVQIQTDHIFKFSILCF